MAWGVWIVAGCVVFGKYLDHGDPTLWPSLAFWGVYLFTPLAYYRQRDEGFVAWVAVVIVATALLLG